MIRATVGGATGGKADGATVGDIDHIAGERFGVDSSQAVIVSAAAFGGKDEVCAVIDDHAIRVFHIQSGFGFSPHLHIAPRGAVGLIIDRQRQPDSCAGQRAIKGESVVVS